VTFTDGGIGVYREYHIYVIQWNQGMQGILPTDHIVTADTFCKGCRSTQLLEPYLTLNRIFINRKCIICWREVTTCVIHGSSENIPMAIPTIKYMSNQ